MTSVTATSRIVMCKRQSGEQKLYHVVLKSTDVYSAFWGLIIQLEGIVQEQL